jgi:hypothetical protein
MLLPILQVEDFSEFGKGKKSAGQGIEGGTLAKGRPGKRALTIGALSRPIRKRIGNLITFKVHCPYRIVHRPQMSLEAVK